MWRGLLILGHVAKYVFILIIVFVAANVVMYVATTLTTPRPEALRAEIEQEVAVGAGFDQVGAWFLRRGIEYSFFPANQPHDTDQEARYQGVWRIGGWANRDVYVRFYVDGERRVKRIDARVLGP
jgi:hypothetical protein